MSWSSFGPGLLGVFNVVVLGYFILLNVSYFFLTLFAFRALRLYAIRMKTVELRSLLAEAGTPPVTLFSPAYNEELTCSESVRSLLTLEYPAFEIIVINDGSTDATMERLKEDFDLERHARFPSAHIPTAEIRDVWRSRNHENLWVIDKENGGKSDALNAALNYCRTPLFCGLDADSILERQALSRLVRPFLEDGDVVAAGGIVRIGNGCTVKEGAVTDISLPRSLLGRFQVLEYLRAFLSGRMGWSALDMTLVISGAFGMFSRSAVVAAGGYSTNTVGEDMELVVRLHEYFRRKDERYKVEFVPDPVAWTEVPENFRGLAGQRDRWQRGLIESLVGHRRMLLNPKYGRIGMIAFPYYFFLEMLGPLIEAVGYVVFFYMIFMGIAPLPYVLGFLTLAVVFGIVLSISAVGLEELTFRRYPRVRDLLRLFGLSVVENLGYRQLQAFWRVGGTISFLRGVKSWGEIGRHGFEKEVEEAQAERTQDEEPLLPATPSA